MTITIEPGRVLWKTRGLYWDFEFVMKPSDPRLPAWQGVLDEVFGKASAENMLYCGVLHVKKDAYPYVAVRFFDSTRVDWTRRPVQHQLIWFPDGIRVGDIPNTIPVDWYLQWIGHAGTAYGSNGVFGLPENKVLNWRIEHPGQSFAEHLREKIIRGLHPKQLIGKVDKDRWAQQRPIGFNRASEAPASSPKIMRLGWLVVLLLISLLAIAWEFAKSSK